jgi:predicted MFS family arabinose efflux permease
MERDLPQAWLALTIGFLTSAISAINNWKVSPLIPTLMSEFSLSSYALAGVMVGAVGAVAVFVVLPGGLLVSRYGPKRVIALSLSATALGSFSQIFAPDFGFLLAGRALEGFGSALTLVSSSTLISDHFSSRHLGMAMGIFAAAPPLGSLLSLNLSAVVSELYGWRTMWILGSALTLPVLACLFLLKGERKSAQQKYSIRDSFSNAGIWLIPLAYFAMVACGQCVWTWGPTYLNKVRGLDMNVASFIPTITSIMALLVSPFGGWLSDRTNVRRWVILMPLVILGVLYPLVPYVATSEFAVMMIVVGIFNNIIPAGVLSEVVKLSGRSSAVGLSVNFLYIQMSIMVGPPFFGLILDMTHSWEASFFSLLLFVLMGVLGVLVAGRYNRNEKRES